MSDEMPCGAVADTNPLEGLVVEPGAVAGRLTVIERALGSRRCHQWRCRCTCGNERVMSTAQLRRIALQQRITKHRVSGCAECCREFRLQYRQSGLGGRGSGLKRFSLADRALMSEIAMTPRRGRLT